jgi:hypothetical protein
MSFRSGARQQTVSRRNTGSGVRVRAGGVIEHHLMGRSSNGALFARQRDTVARSARRRIGAGIRSTAALLGMQ